MSFEVSRHLKEAARRNPHRPAVILASGKRIDFAQLDAETDRFARHFSECGIRSGMRVAVFVRPGLAFVPTIFGCFRIGAIPICLDPGMKLTNLLACLAESQPDAVVGPRRALWAARLFRRPLKSARLRVVVPRIAPGHFSPVSFEGPKQTSDATAAVLFTSGSTGVPKGVVYSHGAFDYQRAILRSTYAIGDDEIDLVVFPLFALFAAAWGITAVIPQMNPARPARASGEHLADLIRRHGVTHSAGSPAIWKNLAEFCERGSVRLPTLRRLLMAGAQVPEALVKRCAKLFDGTVHTPYGATEALPLTEMDSDQLAETYPATRAGAGTCVGRPLAGVDIAVLPLTEGPIAQWDEALRLGPDCRGEIAVRSPWVTREYFARPAANRLSKIPDADGTFWHRMGDVGYLDAEGRLWFCGRKDHRIETAEGVIFPDPWEAIFDQHPGVGRTAVVGVGRQPYLIVEGSPRGAAFEKALRAHGRSRLGRDTIAGIRYRTHFPVDVRHNIKIDRPALARWAEENPS